MKFVVIEVVYMMMGKKVLWFVVVLVDLKIYKMEVSIDILDMLLLLIYGKMIGFVIGMKEINVQFEKKYGIKIGG